MLKNFGLSLHGFFLLRCLNQICIFGNLIVVGARSLNSSDNVSLKVQLLAINSSSSPNKSKPAFRTFLRPMVDFFSALVICTQDNAKNHETSFQQ